MKNGVFLSSSIFILISFFSLPSKTCSWLDIPEIASIGDGGKVLIISAIFQNFDAWVVSSGFISFESLETEQNAPRVSFEMRDSAGSLIDGNLTFVSGVRRGVIFTPSSTLKLGETYQVIRRFKGFDPEDDPGSILNFNVGERVSGQLNVPSNIIPQVEFEKFEYANSCGDRSLIVSFPSTIDFKGVIAAKIKDFGDGKEYFASINKMDEFKKVDLYTRDWPTVDYGKSAEIELSFYNFSGVKIGQKTTLLSIGSEPNSLGCGLIISAEVPLGPRNKMVFLLLFSLPLIFYIVWRRSIVTSSLKYFVKL